MNLRKKWRIRKACVKPARPRLLNPIPYPPPPLHPPIRMGTIQSGWEALQNSIIASPSCVGLPGPSKEPKEEEEEKEGGGNVMKFPRVTFRDLNLISHAAHNTPAHTHTHTHTHAMSLVAQTHTHTLMTTEQIYHAHCTLYFSIYILLYVSMCH